MENFPNRQLLRIMRDIDELKNDKYYDWEVQLCPSSEFNSCMIYLQGPRGTPYEHGLFALQFIFPVEFPFCPPEIYFTTRIFHPNIDGIVGDVSIDFSSICAKTTLRSYLHLIIELLKNPNGTIFVNYEAGFLWNNNRALFDNEASKITRKYAMDHLDTVSVSNAPLFTIAVSLRE